MKVNVIAIVALVLLAVSCTHIHKSHLIDDDHFTVPKWRDLTLPFKDPTSPAPPTYPISIAKGTELSDNK
jgi:hypothetical protein